MLGVRKPVASAAALLAVAGLLIAAPARAGAPAQRVLVPQRVCGAAHPGRASCFAVRLKPMSSTAPTARRYLRAHPDAIARPAAGAGPVGGFTPAQLAKAYAVNPASSAASKQIVAIVDPFDTPTVKADLTHFAQHYGLPAETSTSFKVVKMAASMTTDPDWATETTLDVEAVRGLCHACQIVLVEAQTSNATDLAAAINRAASLHATVISNSYGFPEDVFDGSHDVALTVQHAYAHPGIAILAATGDDGWYDWDNRNIGSFSLDVPQVPASLPTVIGVGGTSLYVNPDGSWAGETVWNANGPSDQYGLAEQSNLGAAGSGCSARHPAPSWQQKVSGYSALGCTSGQRSEVDIAADGDPDTGYDVFQTIAGHGTWTTYGGTSLATPLIAAMFGLAGGPHGVRYPALTLYGHFKGDRGRATHDVTIGGTGACSTSSPTACRQKFNGNPNDAGFHLLDCAFPATGAGTLANRRQCYAAPGYDGVSGVGTPKGLRTFVPIAPHPVIARPGRVRHLFTKRFSAAGTSDPFPGGTIKSYAWSWGDGHHSSGPHPTHRYTRAATRTITLTVTDSYGRRATTRRTITVA